MTDSSTCVPLGLWPGTEEADRRVCRSAATGALKQHARVGEKLVGLPAALIPQRAGGCNLRYNHRWSQLVTKLDSLHDLRIKPRSPAERARLLGLSPNPSLSAEAPG
jgi:hypothetical protein